MLSHPPAHPKGLSCNAHDLSAAEALVQSGGIEQLQNEIDRDGEEIHVREITRLRIARCLDYLSREAEIDPSDGQLLQKIDDAYRPVGMNNRFMTAKKSLHFPDALIYFVDDEDRLLRVYSTILQNAGYSNVRTFSNAIGALDAVTSSTADDGAVPHVVVSGQHMPSLVGTDFFCKVRELPEKFQPSLAILSSRARDYDVQRLSVQHNFDVAEKPFDIHALRKLVHDGLQRHPVLDHVNKLLLIEQEFRGLDDVNASKAG